MIALILHGINGYAGIHWQKWLYNRLIERGDTVFMPTLPHADHPGRIVWLDAVNQQLQNIDLSQLIVIGHSLGVVTGLDYLEHAEGSIKALIAVSGFSEDYGSELNSYFLKTKHIDFSKVNRRTGQSFVIFGDNDPYVPQSVLHALAKDLRVKPVIILNGGHLNTDSGYDQFPYLLEIIEKLG